eukprot:1157818-Pelagomonas_calceolata.AAC.2
MGLFHHKATKQKVLIGIKKRRSSGLCWQHAITAQKASCSSTISGKSSKEEQHSPEKCNASQSGLL